MAVTVVPASRLQRLPGGRDDDLVVEGGATLRALDLSGMRWRHLRLHDGAPLRNELLPRPLRSRRGQLVFEECVFDGLRVRHLEPWRTRFVRCSFRDVRVSYALPGGHFVDCVFSGAWHGNVTAEPPGGDVEPVARIVGNDFRGVTGVAFFGGVRWQDNAFDLGGRHVLLRRGGPGWDRARAAAEDDPQLAAVVSSVEGRGPMGYDQDWQLVERASCSPQTWQVLLAHCLAPGERR